MLSVDQVIVNDNIPTFLRGLELLFGSFYVLNIEYPAGAVSTLEFIQRQVTYFVFHRLDKSSAIILANSLVSST